MNSIRYVVKVSMILVMSSLPMPTLHAQQADFTALFKRLDADHDGQLSKGEFKNLATLGQGKFKDRPEVFNRLFDQLDADRSGALSQAELKGLAKLRPGAQPPVPVPPPSLAKSGPLWRDAIDPEIHQDEALMVYQDARGAVILEHLDPKTGLADESKARVQLDSGAANLRQTFNGPEFGSDARGWGWLALGPTGFNPRSRAGSDMPP